MEHSLTPYERETIISNDNTTIKTNDEDKYWQVYTCQRSIMTKIEKLGIEAYKIDTVEGKPVSKYYKIPIENIKIGKKREVNLSEEQRQALSERAKANFTKNSNDSIEKIVNNIIL